jgi:hypothetical protein
LPHLACPLAGCEGGDLHSRRTKYEFLVTANVPTLLAVLHALRPVPSRGALGLTPLRRLGVPVLMTAGASPILVLMTRGRAQSGC